jgi:hypothetical protein
MPPDSNIPRAVWLFARSSGRALTPYKGMFVSTKRLAVMDLLAGHPAGGVEIFSSACLRGVDFVQCPGDPLLSRAFCGFEIVRSGHLLQQAGDKPAERRLALGRFDPSSSINLVRKRDRDILHIFTTTSKNPRQGTG